ncbi:siderophore-interacting protein [Mycobacterium sp. CBMA271]|uniref:siderophore-interacting protein n=1 Tax=unclassified Mycobacteroides TaxID=2618759 RepID=UPI0012DCF3DA|nr:MULTISPECIES: siderophore-interacting protein [unclassified Mycobacteroides]MUM17552.1 NADPH-dependent ferric siderophore reductase [Mycobacteroides sp. CBMA 326]MUM24653.1 siderophore-interacting protein [Mycobacteroides sp. CBMA 271]
MPTTVTQPTRGWQGAVLKLFRAGDFQLTVTGRRELTEHYLRLSFAAGGLLQSGPVHPTMWIRLWFPDGDKLHQRGYTLVNPDPRADTVDIEFALHNGLAARWAQSAQVGDTIEATVLGSSFALPDPAPHGYVIVGDTASLPAINSLLEAIGDSPAMVFLEAAHENDKTLPVRGDAIWVDRHGDRPLAEIVREAAVDASDFFGWVACDTRTTREVTRVLKDYYGIPRRSMKAQAYWMS